MKDKISLVTSFNSRLYEDPHCNIVESIKEYYPDLDFYVYHENSFDIKNGYKPIEIENWGNLKMYDVFEVNSWLDNFLKLSPLKDCHKIGEQGELDGNSYWRRNAIYWFRKVASIYHCSYVCKTPLLYWVDADSIVTDECRKLDDSILEYANNFTVCTRVRNGLMSEVGQVIYNFNKGGKEFINNFLNLYRKEISKLEWESGEIFNHERWDDGYAFDVNVKKHNTNIGSLCTNTGSPEPYDDTFCHNKGEWVKLRDINKGI
tara:strand:+ start:613 stop:1395 length:783 start_codon:yes stop_codon:yes gene_type:complete